MKDKSVLRNPWLIGVLIAICASVVVATAFHFDAPVIEWVRAHQTSGWHEFMRWVSIIGNWPGHVVVALIGAAIAYLQGNKYWVRVCLALIVACAIGGTAARIGKVTLGRARPTVATMKPWSHFSLGGKNHSFPSGHTTTTFAFFTTLLLARRRFAALLPIPALIGVSRVYLSAHYFSDVVAGVFVGVLCGWLTFRLMRLGQISTQIRADPSTKLSCY